MDDETEYDPIITLVSGEELAFTLPRSAARGSGFIVNALCLDDENERDPAEAYTALEIERVSSSTLEKVVEFLKHSSADPMPPFTDPIADS